jgi:uncharacterized protein (DUF2336 family)
VQARTSLIAELEDALGCGSSQRRAAVLARITDLFIGGADGFDDAQVGLFDDVFKHLIAEIETNALAELGRRLAAVGKAPPRTIEQLAAHEEIAVAGPVLAQAERLDDTTLIDLAKARGQAHLKAISVRRRLSEPVTDVLVDRGDNEVVHSVAANAGARLSREGFDTLVKHAERDELLATKVFERRDVPHQLFRRLLMQATEVVRQRLLARARPETRTLIQQVLTKVSGDIAADATPDYGSALRRVLGRHPEGELSEADLKELAAGKQHEDIIAALSLLVSIPVHVVDRLMRGQESGPVLILCKAAGFEWATVRAILGLRIGARTDSAQRLAVAREEFDRLSRQSAKKVLDLWQARQADAQH